MFASTLMRRRPRICARRPDEQADPDPLLELGDGAAHRRLRQSEGLPGADEAARLHDGREQSEPVERALVNDHETYSCARHGVQRVVGVSALGRGVPGNAGYVTASIAMDDLIASSGVAYRALAMPSFMDNLLRQVESIKHRGTFVSTIRPDLEAPTCATQDIAAVAARLLLDRTWNGTADVPVLGPEDLSHDEMATVMSEVLGSPVRYQQIPLAAMKATMLERGMSEAMAQGRIDMMAAKDAGADRTRKRLSRSSVRDATRCGSREVDINSDLRPASGSPDSIILSRR